MAFGDTRILTPLELTRRFESPAGQKEYRARSQLLVATPAVLSYLGLEPSAVDPGADFLVDRGVVTDGLFIRASPAAGCFPSRTSRSWTSVAASSDSPARRRT
jgi:hypothetical protein